MRDPLTVAVILNLVVDGCWRWRRLRSLMVMPPLCVDDGCAPCAAVRENGEMGVDAANMLVREVLKNDENTINSFCGVTKTKISLSIPRKDNADTDLIFIATELEANSWAESNGGKGKPFAEIRRRSSHSYGDWSPLLFAAREGILELCEILIKRGADINQKDQDKLNPGYTALITAATRGDLEMCQLLVDAKVRRVPSLPSLRATRTASHPLSVPTDRSSQRRKWVCLRWPPVSF